MNEHQVRADQDWFNCRYSGEEADDGCANELSLYRLKEEDRLELLLTNVDFAGRGHDNTFSLSREDARCLRDFLDRWLAKQQPKPSTF